MTTLYLWDAQRIYSHSVEQDPFKPAPENSTQFEPPLATGAHVAQWSGTGWVLLASRPPVPPAVPQSDPVPEPAVLTVLQLRRLFTFAEKVALEDAIKNGNSAVKVLMDDLSAADFVDLSDPLVIEGIQFLVQHEFLTQARAEQILNNEMPNV